MSLAINPHRFLPWMQHHLESLYGITFHRRNLKSVEEIRDVLPCEIIINASGLGAKSLASDASVSAVRGQTMLIKSSALKVNMNEHVMIRRGKEYTYVIPRSFSGGVVIGGIEDEANLDVRVDGKLRQDILRRVNRMTGGTFSDVDLESDVIKDIVGFRPGRRGGYRIERQGNIVHAYGFAGAGYRYSFGAAARVVDLVDELGFVPKPRL